MGIKATSGEVIVGMTSGVWRTRTFSKRPEQDKWNAGDLQFVGGVPWRLSDQDPKVDGEPMLMDVPQKLSEDMKGEQEACGTP